MRFGQLESVTRWQQSCAEKRELKNKKEIESNIGERFVVEANTKSCDLS